MKIIILVLCLAIVAYPSFAQEFSYDSHDRRDPFLRLVTREGAILNLDQEYAVSDLILEGIIFDTAQSYAIINGMIVKKNDKVGFFVVSKIEKNRVILKKGQDTFILELKKED